MANELDLLMARLEEDPINAAPKDIDEVIAYYRQQRANVQAGIKPKKDKGPALPLDNIKAGLMAAKPVAPVASSIRRRV